MILSRNSIRIMFVLVLQSIGFSYPLAANSTPETSEDYNTWQIFAVGDNLTLFKFFNGRLNFIDAMKDCHRRRAELASFHSLEELQLIFEEANTITNSSKNFWIGLFHIGERVNGLPNLKMYFTDGTQYDLPTTKDFHKEIWMPLGDNYQPDAYWYSGSNQTEQCVEATSELGSHEYFLNDVPCSTILEYYVCMRKYAWEKPQWMKSVDAAVTTPLPSLRPALESASEHDALDPKQEVNPDNGMDLNPQSNSSQSTDATQELQKIHRFKVTGVCSCFYSSSLYSTIAEIGFPVALICIILGLLGLQRSSLRNRLLAYTNDNFELANTNNICLSNI